MSKFNRFICCLILPILAMICLSGCGDARSTKDIMNKFSKIRETYKIEVKDSDDDINEFFDTKTGLLDITYLGNEMSKVEEKLTLDYFKNDINLYKRYYALINLQHTVLNNILVYYVGMSDSFYENAEVKGVSEAELKTLYNKLETFGMNLDTFKVAKDKLEETVDVLTFNGVVRADLTSYSYSVNLLIEQTFDFVSYFKELNTKYHFSGDVTEENKVSYVKYYLYEACYELTELEYYRYLKPFNNVNECDLSGLVTVNVAEATTLYYDGGELIELIENVVAMDKSFKNLDDSFGVDDVEDFQEVRNAFKQKFNIYKIVYGNMDYYEYNSNLVQGYEQLISYIKTLGEVEVANISLIEKFYQTTLISYIEECLALKVG